jgi:hypothetical protein
MVPFVLAIRNPSTVHVLKHGAGFLKPTAWHVAPCGERNAGRVRRGVENTPSLIDDQSDRWRTPLGCVWPSWPSRASASRERAEHAGLSGVRGYVVSRPSCSAPPFLYFPLPLYLIVCLDGLQNYSISKTSQGLLFSPYLILLNKNLLKFINSIN